MDWLSEVWYNVIPLTNQPQFTEAHVTGNWYDHAATAICIKLESKTGCIVAASAELAFHHFLSLWLSLID